ncbi:TetR/AcrR family transcriptional regulator C-terminal domain-containing protein [Kutzneria sp. CA-103260]|uniref:TetR/AcrR family transcriptional regulator C-terminal domain-containing protein n=1 Tax=Kutzneria sp. CA-103260 TaxID=2802641 RepID=UPI001BABB7A8|nr:TetR/AcrR family transcriptional regulator C-terminal domain-containing protein [Kutzneria sp. CA-103260]QUQ67681.1 HTH-type transcriptional regulator BetI [Kutzneria sp. CA-103260]
MPLRREQVVEAALELLDEVGLDAFTTRALTDRLGVQRGALYWHVKSKQELLAAVTELVLRPVFADDGREGGDWADDLTEYAHRLRAAMLAHRDGARLVAAHVTVNQSGTEQLAESLERYLRQGIPMPVAARWGDIVSSYVTGYVLQEQTAPAGDPSAGAAMEPWFPDGHPSSGETFAASVATIILGMRAEAAALTPASPALRQLNVEFRNSTHG